VIENVAENDDDEIDVDSDAEPALVVNEAENELEDENEKMEKTLSEEVVDVSNIPLPPAMTTTKTCRKIGRTASRSNSFSPIRPSVR
jgi:hypothetical protein